MIGVVGNRSKNRRRNQCFIIFLSAVMGCGLVPWASVLCELMRPDPCQSSACEIQKCLQANKYQEEACQNVFRQMERCCSKWKDQSVSCSGFKFRKSPSSHPTPIGHVKHTVAT